MPRQCQTFTRPHKKAHGILIVAVIVENTMAWLNMGIQGQCETEDIKSQPASPMKKMRATLSQQLKVFSPRRSRRQLGKPPMSPALSVDDDQECPIIPLEPTKSRNEIAVVACGCFWSPQRRFQKMNGVKRVIAGYTGGQSPEPSADYMKDHTQALFIEYNPRKVSYRDILKMWLDNDYPYEPEEDLAYRSALFVLNQDQHAKAVEFLTVLHMSRPNCQLYVDIEPAGTFYRAEEAQQDYLKKQVLAAREQFLLWANDSASSGLHSITE